MLKSCDKKNMENVCMRVCVCKEKQTQCFLSTSSSASHLRVKNGYFLEIISPSKNVVNVGNSSVRPFILR